MALRRRSPPTHRSASVRRHWSTLLWSGYNAVLWRLVLLPIRVPLLLVHHLPRRQANLLAVGMGIAERLLVSPRRGGRNIEATVRPW